MLHLIIDGYNYIYGMQADRVIEAQTWTCSDENFLRNYIDIKEIRSVRITVVF